MSDSFATSNTVNLGNSYVAPWTTTGYIDVVCWGVLLTSTVLTLILVCIHFYATKITNGKESRPVILGQLCLSFLLFLVTLAATVHQSHITDTGCLVISILMVYALCSIFTWASIDPLCIVIISTTYSRKMRLPFYSIIGWGFPMLLTTGLVIVHFLPASDIFHQAQCMVNALEQPASLAAPLGLLFLANLVLMVAAGVRLKNNSSITSKLQLQFKSCRLTYLLLILPSYLLFGATFTLHYFKDNNITLVLEYVLFTLVIIIISSLWITTLFVDPTVKNCLMNEARQLQEEKARNPPAKKVRHRYIP